MIPEQEAAEARERVRYRRHMVKRLQYNDDMEIDFDAPVVLSENGAWVKVWVWVSRDELPDEENAVIYEDPTIG